jgi:hypothetical protein
MRYHLEFLASGIWYQVCGEYETMAEAIAEWNGYRGLPARIIMESYSN